MFGQSHWHSRYGFRFLRRSLKKVKLGRFKKLYTSARNCKRVCSLSWKFLLSVKSQVARPGPCKKFRPTFPSSRSPGGEKASGLKYRPLPVGSLETLGAPQMICSRVKPGAKLGVALPSTPSALKNVDIPSPLSVPRLSLANFRSEI